MGSKHSHNFKDAIAQIPSLIAKEMQRSNGQHPSANQLKRAGPQPSQVHPVYTSPRHSIRWLFIGVITCSALILCFWLIYVSDLIRTHRSTINPMNAFNTSEDNNLSNLISTFSTLEHGLKENLTSPSELKAMVAEALTPLLTASSTTSTPDTTPSSTEHIEPDSEISTTSTTL